MLRFYRFYEQRNKVRLLCLECKPGTRWLWLTHFQVKMPENGTKNILRDKQARNTERLIFLDLKVLTNR